MMISVDLSRYPLFRDLEDPHGMITMILDKEYAVFAARCSSSSNVELLKVVSDTCQELTDRFAVMEDEQTTSINNVLSQIPILLAKSTTKGTIAEKCSIEYIKENLCNIEYSIEDTSKISNSGDILVTKKDFACMIDTKHYKQKVPRKEVDKLKRDMTANGIQCGIITNYNSGITGYKNIDIEFFDDNEKTYCLAILGNLSDNPIKLILTIHYLEALRSSLDTVQIEKTTETYDDLLETTCHLQTLITKFEQHKRIIDESLSDYHKQLIVTITSYISNLKHRLEKS